MAFRALLFSKSSDTTAALTAACFRAEIRAEVCSDIFTAIEKGKTRAFSCVIVDWADQPEASFLLKRARESTPNRETVAVAVVDRNPTQAELRDSKLDFLICRPIVATEAEAVLAKACETMKPMSAEDAREAFADDHASNAASTEASAEGDAHDHDHSSPTVFQESNHHQSSYGEQNVAAEPEKDSGRSFPIGFRSVCATALILAAAFFLWSSRDVLVYLTRTPEGKLDVLRESFAALFNTNKTGAMPIGAAGTDAQQDAYFSRDPSYRDASNSDGRSPGLKVVATQSALSDSHIPLPKAAEIPLPQPVVEREEVAPVHIERAAIPESMRNSAPIERPVVVTVNPSLMPVSAPVPQPAAQPQSFTEPVAVSEEAERALLTNVVNPVYPPEAAAQKLHGPVVLQASIGRDGSVQDLKIVRGYFILGRAAIAAVKQWKFQPYNVNGHPAATQTTITINFN